jgi:hypothetical protein
MTTEHEQLLQQYQRLQRAAQAVVDAADYATQGEDEARVYASQLRTLRRELKGTPQPHGMWMSAS